MCSAQGSTTQTSTSGDAGEVGGVQAADRAAADDRDPDRRVAGHDAARAARGDVRGRLRVGAADAEARHQPAVVADRQPAREAEDRRRHQRGDGAGRPETAAEVAAVAVEQRRRGRGGLRDRERGGRRAVHQVLLDGVAAAVDDGDRDRDAAARCFLHGPSAEPSRPVELGLAAGRRRGGHAEAVGRVDDQVAEALLPALAVVAVLALVGDAERVGDQQVLRVGGPAVGADRARVDVGREERADGRAGGGDAGHHDAVRVPDREAARAGEQRLGRRRGEPGRDRRGDRGHPVQVLGARDLLGGRDPRLRPGPRHPAGPARVHPGRGEQGAARADDGDRAAQAELLGLVDRALDEGAGLGEAEIARVARSGRAVTRRPCCSRRPPPCSRRSCGRRRRSRGTARCPRPRPGRGSAPSG